MSGPPHAGIKTLHPPYRVSDLDRSLAFYAGVGYEPGHPDGLTAADFR